MHYRKLAAFFVIVALISSVINPFNANGSSQKEEYVVVESKNDEVHESHNNDNEKPHEQHSDQSNSNEQNPIPQTAKDEGDNSHPSGNDRSEEHGKSETQGKSQSDPDDKENAHGGISGQDKLGYDGGLDKGDQDGNNGCGNDDDFEDDNNGNCKGKNNDLPSHDPKNDHPGKNPGGCDVNGSTGDKNGRPCDPGKNNASEQGCLNGEPDCDNKTDKPKDKEKEKEWSHDKNHKDHINISIVINIDNQVGNQQSTQPTTSQVLAASTLAATGDSLFKLAVALILMGTSSFIFGLLFLFRKAINKVFNSSYQSYLYLYEA